MPYNDNGQAMPGSFDANRYPRNDAAGGFPQNSRPRSNAVREQSNGPVLFNDEAGKFLHFNYWSRSVALEIGTVQPGSPMTWDVRSQAPKVRQNLSYGDLSNLWSMCDTVLDSVKNTGTFTSIGTKVGSAKDAMVEINDGSRLGMPNGIYLVIYKGLDSGSRPASMEVYPFPVEAFVRGYDPNTGIGKTDLSRVSEFKKFKRAVKAACEALSMAVAHTVKSESQYDKLAMFRSLSNVGSAMGIDMGAELQNILRNSQPRQTVGGNGYGNGGNRFYGGGSYGSGAGNSASGERSSMAAEQQAALASIDDPVDMNLTMADLTNVDMSSFK